MVKKKTKELQLWSSTPKKLAKTPPKPTVTPRKSPRLIAKDTNSLNSSCRKVVLDFGDDPGPTQPIQASVGENLHVGGSQGIVDLENDARFWTKASAKVTNVEEAFKAIQESVCNLDNIEDDECHPEYASWTQPLLYSEGEDATDWTEFCNNFEEVSGGDDGYEQLLETDDEAEDKLKIDGPVIDLGPDFFTNALEEDNGLEVINGSPVDESLEIPNGPRQWFNDYEDIFGEDSLENEELFSEAAEVEQVVEPGLVEVGLQFSDKLAFKKHLRAYCVQHGIQYKLKKSNNLRIRAVCKISGPPLNCPWFMYARKLPNEPTFSIKGFCLEHTCIGDPLGRFSSANPKFVAQCVMEKLKTSTSFVLPKPAEIANDFWTSHNTLVPYHVSWKARNIVLEKINGSYDETYKLVPSLCEMIRMTNPGFIAKFTYGRNDKCFDSVTISFDGPMRGFINGCRPIVGLDGCHLNGKYGGCLLSATSLDAHNGLVPLGIMICRNECFKNWYFFLKDLIPRLVDHKLQLNFISNR
ncbi:hypothetical protein MKX01_006767 [Papaver californicum]|nr:hypothetical protein MKX01_006767 [Papaver californicum]